MLQLHVTAEKIKSSFSAVKFANSVATRVGSAVFSIAKSYLWSSQQTSITSQKEKGDPTASPPLSSSKVTHIPSVLSLRDGGRQITRIVLSPAQYHLAAMADTLGRILLLDTNTCEIVAIWKGFRGGQCEWVESVAVDKDANTENPTSQAQSNKRLASDISSLCLVMYASRLGLLQVYSMVDHATPLSSFSVGRGYQLVSCVMNSLGDSLIVDNGASARSIHQPQAASCILINDTGSVIKINVFQHGVGIE
ncbi:hypothetical protein BB558_000735 [Smittium angustum]|uniref:Rab3-GAP regulatory subunit N-terminal domain-containing protein n=1 Tax=Smittium angustum TaxID=133377 RepID=A0A2U1JDB5_SMIAN|nr:hypothetical protein BB558_002118 [Smittium angustum]PWA03096.1 hypothetical protein BB558_000735 [Smittium angustum]